MSGWHAGTVSVPHCSHNVSRYEWCGSCDYEREANDLAERRRIDDPMQVITDALDRQRPWFARCVFCSLGQPTRDALPPKYHALSCPFVTAMAVATTLYEQHCYEAVLTKGADK